MKTLPNQIASESVPVRASFNPIYPAHETQLARLLAMALVGEQINPLRGWRHIGIYRLSDTKFRLKEMGCGWLSADSHPR